MKYPEYSISSPIKNIIGLHKNVENIGLIILTKGLTKTHGLYKKTWGLLGSC